MHAAQSWWGLAPLMWGGEAGSSPRRSFRGYFLKAEDPAI